MNFKSFTAGFALAVALVASMGAISGQSEKERYLEACVAIQGEYAMNAAAKRLRNNEKAVARIEHFVKIMNEYQP